MSGLRVKTRVLEKSVGVDHQTLETFHCMAGGARIAFLGSFVRGLTPTPEHVFKRSEPTKKLKILTGPGRGLGGDRRAPPTFAFYHITG